MEKDRNSRIIAVIAMIIAVGSLSLGFAAFSNTLVIQPQAIVEKDASTFNVDLSSTATTVTDGNVTGSITGTAVAGQALITNSTSGDTNTISDLNATFKAPGDQVVYTFYAVNVGEFDAYLKSVNFADVQGESGKIVCEAKDSQTTDSLVEAACDGISISVKVGGDEEEFTSTTAADDFTKAHKITKVASSPYNSEKIIVTLKYDSNAARADGDFDVKFGNVSLVYSSVPNAS